MPKKITDTMLPTTMAGSFPRPHWFKQQLLGRDIRVAFKEVAHEEAYNDPTQVAIRDQEEAGLDVVFTNNPDDYKCIGGVIEQWIDEVNAKIARHFCFGNAWGNSLNSLFPKGYETVLPYYSASQLTSSCSTSPTRKWPAFVPCGSAARARVAEHRLWNEAAAQNCREDEAQSASRGAAILRKEVKA